MLDYSLDKMTKLDRELVLSRGDVDMSGALMSARETIEAVRRGGDETLKALARKYDGFTGESLTVPVSAIHASVRGVAKEVLKSLELSKTRIEAFHSKQELKPFEFKDECGTLGQKVVPMDRVGVYVPGGTAAYMSSVLMACIPARIAGVKDIAICTPGKGGKVPAEILAAASLCGVSEVHPVGGAHAIAAMAYGTESINRVQKIVGPGGLYVSAAKLLVRNDCEIDFLAGPSEILVIADSKANPRLIACDMLAQLEHDPLARAVLVATSKGVLEDSQTELARLMSISPRGEIASLAAKRGAIFIFVKSLDEAVKFSNEYAPEHLLLDVEKPGSLLQMIRSAGSVFLGSSSSVVFGDYCSGTNHILPTKGTASMKSSLSVYDFLKVIPYQSISDAGAAKLSKTVDILARAEGLPAHADAALARVAKEAKR
jgi:histidinol dehydrogenase